MGNVDTGDRKAMNTIPVTRALISVSDKAGLVAFTEELVASGVTIVSSGGTAAYLESAGIAVTMVETVTGAKEMLGGRVKTLHPNIHGAILADLGEQDHVDTLAERGIEPFQLVVSNLYPFEEVTANGADHATAIEHIDIGGPTLIRAAAKNHAWVAIVVSPGRYKEVAAAVAGGGTTAELRADLAREAFFRTASYDASIVNWLHSGTENSSGVGDPADSQSRHRLVLPLTLRSALRYGENPHQPAGLYATGTSTGWWAGTDQIQGKEMSFNNYADADAAWRLVNDLPETSVVIIKHMNACGAATAATTAEAFAKAWEGDPQSSFGSVVACNAEVDAETAEAVSQYFVEIVIAPGFTHDALSLLSAKENLRVLAAPPPSNFDLDIRTIDAGFLVQKRDSIRTDSDGWTFQTRQPTESESNDLAMAWVIAAHTKSNAIVLVKDRAAIAVGAGDQSRIGAAERAISKAGDRIVGSVCASDAFFPFRDGTDVLAEAGVTAIIEPGGSIRDEEVIQSATDHDVALVFTSERHFKH